MKVITDYALLGVIRSSTGEKVCMSAAVINFAIAAMAKAAFNKKKKKNLFTRKLDLNFEEETTEMLRLEHGSVWC